MIRSLQDSLVDAELRLDNYRKSMKDAEFVAVELDRIETKIQALTEMAVQPPGSRCAERTDHRRRREHAADRGRVKQLQHRHRARRSARGAARRSSTRTSDRVVQRRATDNESPIADRAGATRRCRRGIRRGRCAGRSVFLAARRRCSCCTATRTTCPARRRRRGESRDVRRDRGFPRRAAVRALGPRAALRSGPRACACFAGRNEKRLAGDGARCATKRIGDLLHGQERSRRSCFSLLDLFVRENIMAVAGEAAAASRSSSITRRFSSPRASPGD